MRSRKQGRGKEKSQGVEDASQLPLWNRPTKQSTDWMNMTEDSPGRTSSRAKIRTNRWPNIKKKLYGFVDKLDKE